MRASHTYFAFVLDGGRGRGEWGGGGYWAQRLGSRNWNPKTLGRGQGEEQFLSFCLSLRVHFCEDLLVVPDPPPCVCTLKIPYPHVDRKRIGFTARGMETQKHCIQGGGGEGGWGGVG